jgi:hypothetical protein
MCPGVPRSITSGMTRRAAIGLVALWLLATVGITAAHGAEKTASRPSLRTAGPFLLDEMRFKADGKWGLVWRSLYPAHRLVAPRATYVRCEQATPFIARLDSARVVAVRRALVRVPGATAGVPGVAVTVRISLPWYGPRDPIVFTHTFHLVPVRGHWTWLLSPQRYSLYRHDGCGNFPAV